MAKKSEVVQSVNTAAVGALTNASGPVRTESTGVAPLPVRIDPISNKMVNETVANPLFTGIARSVVCVKNQGFNNFQICTLYIENGQVLKMEKSDRWVNFETIAILDHISHLSMIHLNDHFEDGKAFLK